MSFIEPLKNHDNLISIKKKNVTRRFSVLLNFSLVINQPKHLFEYKGFKFEREGWVIVSVIETQMAWLVKRKNDFTDTRGKEFNESTIICSDEVKYSLDEIQ